MKPTDPLLPINRIAGFVGPPSPRSAATEDDEETKEADEASDDDADADTDDEDDEDSLVGDDGDSDDGDGDDDDDEGEEDTPENYLRTKMYLAMEEEAALTCGKVIVHEDPLDEDKLLVVMQLDKFIEDEEMPDLTGAEMRDVSVILIFEGKGSEGPKKRILSLDKLSQLFDQKNWKKNRNKKVDEEEE